jgi:hypothetical protein
MEINGKLLLELAFETTTLLNTKKEQLEQCKWTDGESNTDTDFSTLACQCAEEAWKQMQKTYNLQITLKAVIPDINCTFEKDGTILKVTKIELKSSKTNVMPGSTIGKLDINQPLIFCNRKTYEVRCGQYHTAMGDSDIDLFQDRTPRPSLNFNKLSTKMDYVVKQKDAWVSHYGKCAVTRLNRSVTPSWQDTLTKSILYEALQHIETLEELQQLRESVYLPLQHLINGK